MVGPSVVIGRIFWTKGPIHGYWQLYSEVVLGPIAHIQLLLLAALLCLSSMDHYRQPLQYAFYIIGDLFDKTCYLAILQLINHSLYHLHQAVLLVTQVTYHTIESMKPAHFIPQKERGPEHRSDAIILLLSSRYFWSAFVISARG
jgi:hypothetical protein